jgi:peptidylprolyl isomerase
VGVPVGSRVMLVIPPALGYGPAGGQASAGITKTDTLVFVIDVIGGQPASS